jgi:DNA-binding MarR family transcriptional regulator
MPAKKARTLPESGARPYRAPLTVSHEALLAGGDDQRFRSVVYLMVLGFGRMLSCRDAFGRAIALTPSQYAVLIGVAHTQGDAGVSIRTLSAHVLLAATHVTTDVGRLERRGLLTKRVNPSDRRGVLVSLSAEGEAAVEAIAPLVRRTNDTLFKGVDTAGFIALERFLHRFADQSAKAVEALQKPDQPAGAPWV